MYYGIPEIFNTDPGSQFTSNTFTGLPVKNGITISREGWVRALDNVEIKTAAGGAAKIVDKFGGAQETGCD